MFLGIPIAFVVAMLLIMGGARYHDVQERKEVQVELAKQNKHCVKFNLDNECIKEEKLRGHNSVVE
jgi:hypothetical protein